MNQIGNPALNPVMRNQSGTEYLGNLISAAIGWVMIIGAIAFIFMLLIGAIQWLISGGDKSAVEGARNRISHALIGLLILFSLWAVIQLLETFLGIEILGDTIFLPTINQTGAPGSIQVPGSDPIAY